MEKDIHDKSSIIQSQNNVMAFIPYDVCLL